MCYCIYACEDCGSLVPQKPDDVIEVEIELDELEDAGILVRLV